MLLLLHILIAILGLCAAGAAFIKPSTSKIKLSYGLLVSTLLSGILLIFINQASILHTCMSGLTFTGIMYAGIAAAGRKLSLDNYSQKTH